MGEKGIFNATVCLIGIAIFLIHSVDLILKRGKRKDELNLLAFFLFTAFHFSVYLTFTFLKANYSSDAFIMSFYTAFYIMNNVEALFLFVYAISYIRPRKNIVKITMAVNFAVFGIYVLLDIANLFGHFFFSASGGVYVRAPTMFFSQGYQFVAFIVVFVMALMDKKLHPTEKSAFIIYCVLPLVAIGIQNALEGYAIAYLSIVISIEVLFLFANVRKNAALASEERKSKEAEVRIMMSQIRPHFIYNALSSISTLIETDPEKAQMALDQFTDYLRANLSALTDTHLIPFQDELRHIETYLALEMLRFEERLKVIYDIQDDSFLVPPLCIQPLVENAAKHGILQKLEGGTITIRTYQSGDYHFIEIKDDGIGFDPGSIEGSEHVGLANVSYRIRSMVDGELDIQSKPNQGTLITVKIHMEGRR